MKACVTCGTEKKLTQHHVNGGGKGVFIPLCEHCHQEVHGNIETTVVENGLRRVRRARRRIMRELKIIEATQKMLREKEVGK